MGYKSPRTYTLCGSHNAATGYNPIDATNFYGGGATNIFGTGAAIRQIGIPITGVIRQISLQTYSATVTGSNENWLMSLYDGTTTTAIATLGLATPPRTWSSANLNFPVTAGGYVQFLSTTPTWATNPEGLSGSWVIVVEYE